MGRLGAERSEGMVEAGRLEVRRGGGIENVGRLGAERGGGMGYVPHVCRSNLRMIVDVSHRLIIRLLRGRPKGCMPYVPTACRQGFAFFASCIQCLSKRLR